MPRQKELTQFIFDDIENKRGYKEMYGTLGDMYEMFASITAERPLSTLIEVAKGLNAEIKLVTESDSMDEIYHKNDSVQDDYMI